MVGRAFLKLKHRIQKKYFDCTLHAVHQQLIMFSLFLDDLTCVLGNHVSKYHLRNQMIYAGGLDLALGVWQLVDQHIETSFVFIFVLRTT